MAINLPQKPRPGFHAIQELTRAVNGLIDYISTFSIIGKKPIRVTRKMFQTEISLDKDYIPESSVEGSGIGYNGPFKVVLNQNNKLDVICGYDENSSIAGYAYYNIKIVTCWKTSNITPQEGFLCLNIQASIGWHTYYDVGYTFESDIPDMPTLSNNNGDNTVKYPLAEIVQTESGWKINQLCYGFPQLWCFAPCDNDSVGDN